ncbi:MAG TPA: chromosome segregation protein SMC, partial [Methylophilaceae bacterium]|nr:chromosome segregation protein SMC [Methylophilaceae bacterium]
DSMDAVIFNGSGNRKAISRASVELFFDNSLGGANGEWAQYAEIAVKRVIERDKGSSYYINNTPVRRRDVADLFLGTGLGGRAYAIIGQNTISRIVEAKPEELRIFLEEAAGISKYKERRRETELRLRDTRENLTRIEDIRRELDKQITKLESQALIAEQYHRLQTALKHAHGQLWLLKKRDASTAWEKSKRQVEKLVNELEAQMAALRKTETALESLRQQHYASTEAVQTAQTRYYEANAEVSSLEQQVKNTTDARERLTVQLQQLAAQSQKMEAQGLALQESLQQLNTRQLEADTNETQAEQALQAVGMSMPKAEQEYAAALQADADAQKTLTDAEQSIRLETANLDHLSHTITEIIQRLQHLENEQARLQLPDEAELAQKQTAYEKAQKA